jgi:hypothetical protein
MPEATKTNDQIIRGFLEKMSTQDNACTAWPVFFVIRDASWAITDEAYATGDYRIRYVNKECCEDVITAEEYDKLPARYDDVSADDRLHGKCSQEEYKRFCERNLWQHRGLFLTRTDAEQHLELNRHHYSSQAHVYADHVWRAPELEEFLRALHDTYNIPPRKDPSTM